MSETEHKKGKLKPTGKTVEQYMNGETPPDYYEMPEDLFEWFEDKHYRSAVEIKGMVFEVEMEDIQYEAIFESLKKEDGSIDFQVKFYNGVFSFNEAIGRAVKGI